MSTTDPFTWAYHPDFVDTLMSKAPKIALRLLETADIALSFARHLVAKEYGSACEKLATSCAQANSPDVLREQLEQMVNYTGQDAEWPTNVQVVTATDASDMDGWVAKESHDFGWAYVAISGDGYNEAVSVVIAEINDQLAIREIEWGRP